ncbi:MAG: AI-2E family transporter [Bdellovibrionia bacterium]
MDSIYKRAAGIIVMTLFSLLLIAAIFFAKLPLLVTAIGIGVGVLISPALDAMHRKLRIPRSVGAVLFLLVWAAVIGGVGFLVYSLLWSQVSQLASHFPELSAEASRRLADLFNRFPSISDNLRKVNFGGNAQTLVGALGQSIRGGIEAITGLIFIIAVSLYISSSRERYVDSLLSLFPKTSHARARFLMGESATALRRWFVAQLIAMSCVGVCASIGFLIIGMPYWAVLGALTAVLDIIPFVGPTIAAVCAVLIALGSDPSKALWVVVNFVIVEHIESNLVVPMVMKGQVDLPPVHLLTLMLIFGNWFGILGVLIAPPTLAVARTLYLLVYVPSINAGKPEIKRDRAA